MCWIMPIPTTHKALSGFLAEQKFVAIGARWSDFGRLWARGMNDPYFGCDDFASRLSPQFFDSFGWAHGAKFFLLTFTKIEKARYVIFALRTKLPAYNYAGHNYPRNPCAIGTLRPIPNARAETFSPGAACLRLYSLKTILFNTSRTTSRERSSPTSIFGSASSTT